MDNQNQRAYLELPVVGNHPCVSILCTNVRLWGRNEDGIPCPATEPKETFIALHGTDPDAYLAGIHDARERGTYKHIIAATHDQLALQVYETKLVVHYGEPDRCSSGAALYMANVWTDEESSRMVSAIVLPESFDEDFHAVRGEDPTDEDRAACISATATDRLLKEHLLLGLTADILKAVQEKRMDIYVIREDARSWMERSARRSFDMKELRDALDRKDPGLHVPQRYKDNARRGVMFTALDEDRTPHGICYYEMPTEGRRGLIVAFEASLFTRALLSVHHVMLNWYPTFLWQFPPPPFCEEPRRREYRPRRHRRQDGRRHSQGTDAPGMTGEEGQPEGEPAPVADAPDEPDATDGEGEPAPDQADEDPPAEEEPGDDEAAGDAPAVEGNPGAPPDAA